MAINSSDNSYAIVPETVAGTTPANPAFKKIDHIPGTSPEYSTELLESPVVTAGRASGGARKNNPTVGGGISTHACFDDAIFTLIESACSGRFVEDAEDDDKYVLKAGANDLSFTIEKKLAGATPLYMRFTGNQVAAMTISAAATDNVIMNFDLTGMAYTSGTTALSGSTYANPSASTKMTGLDTTVTVAGLSSFKPSKYELKVEQTKNIQRVLGQFAGGGVNTEGNRKVSGSVTFYREDLTAETLFAGDNAVDIKFLIAVAGENESIEFNIPSAIVNFPQSESEGGSEMVTITFQAKLDGAKATDLIVTRIG